MYYRNSIYLCNIIKLLIGLLGKTAYYCMDFFFSKFIVLSYVTSHPPVFISVNLIIIIKFRINVSLWQIVFFALQQKCTKYQKGFKGTRLSLIFHHISTKLSKNVVSALQITCILFAFPYKDS